jgi:hypothetical protein
VAGRLVPVVMLLKVSEIVVPAVRLIWAFAEMEDANRMQTFSRTFLMVEKVMFKMIVLAPPRERSLAFGRGLQ